eukprot:TRINITY_DN12933_c0_g1_i2.p1 TRINITY_DN12933_c0_g1~~TRINITY_DN12933_c0_g1_i2.p1  ORF type:complete len:195 (-),score=25.25 TRINITY_DN12933_c0_g1_i2:4-507(-)
MSGDMGSEALARQRLTQERKDWRKHHPAGFYARPETKPDGSVNLFRWRCGIPGPENTPWQGGMYTLEVHFPSDYPMKPPDFRFIPIIFHPNVFKSGHICLSILKSEKDYSPSLSLSELLLGIQKLLIEPNINDPANMEAAELFKHKTKYAQRIRQQAAQMRDSDEDQ